MYSQKIWIFWKIEIEQLINWRAFYQVSYKNN